MSEKELKLIKFIIISVTILIMFFTAFNTVKKTYLTKPVTPLFIIIDKTIFKGLRNNGESKYKVRDIHGNTVEFWDEPNLYHMGDTIHGKTVIN